MILPNLGLDRLPMLQYWSYLAVCQETLPVADISTNWTVGPNVLRGVVGQEQFGLVALTGVPVGLRWFLACNKPIRVIYVPHISHWHWPNCWWRRYACCCTSKRGGCVSLTVKSEKMAPSSQSCCSCSCSYELPWLGHVTRLLLATSYSYPA
jgi:hypothetical protein